MDFPEEILASPTRCYMPGCERENELLLHVADDPWGGSDVCMPHARWVISTTPLIWTCECTFCERARAVVTAHKHPEDVVLCPCCTGVWVIKTASGSAHRLDLDAKTAQRIQDVSRSTPSPTEMWSDRLRRDGEVLPLYRLEPVRIGQRAIWVLGEVDDYEGYLSTTRETTPVVSVEVADDADTRWGDE